MLDHVDLKKLPAAAAKRVIQLTELFIEYVGPIGLEISGDVFSQWASAGKFGPAAMRHYALALSQQLTAESERHSFLQKAEKLLLQ